jgi:hypothetical protein
MSEFIKIRIKKEINGNNKLKVLKLKTTLITDI